MTDREALYRAILANPTDDTPRLVYADWLQENDRPEEGEFLRVGCQLEAVPPDHADYPALLARVKELELSLGAHLPVPAPKFPNGLQVAGDAAWWTSNRRGFPRFLEFDGTPRPGLRAVRALGKSLERAFATIPTRWLVVRFVTVEQLAELLKHPAVATLDRLTVQCQETQAPVDDFARVIADAPNLRNLRGLSLAFPPGADGVAALARSAHLSNLEWFALDAYHLTRPGVQALGTSNWFRGLRSLWFHSALPGEAFQELCRLEPFSELHTLDLRRIQLSAESWQVFARSKAFPRLASLALGDAEYGGTYMSDDRVAALAGATGFQLASLDLSHCSIHAEGAAALLKARWLGSLRWLSLRGSMLWPAATAAVARSRTLANLQYLDLSNNWIGASGLKALTGNPALHGLRALLLGAQRWQHQQLTPAMLTKFLTDLKLPQLRHLALSGRPLGGRASRLLADDKFRSLTRLELNDCKLTDAAVTALLAAPALQNLIELNLANNKLSSGADPLADPATLPRLSRCDLTGNRLADETRKALARRVALTV